MFFALQTMSNSPVTALIGGALWGGAIFLLDSFIVASYRKNDNKWKEFRVALPRLLLALVLGASISLPLELKVFSREIAEGLKEMNNIKDLQNFDIGKSKYDKQIAPYIQEKGSLVKENENLNIGVEALDRKIIKLEDDLTNEIGARGRTGKYGKGPVALEIEKQLDTARADKKKEEARVFPKLHYNDQRILELDSLIATVKQVSPERSDLGGISAQLDVLKSLIKNNSYVGVMYWIFLLLVLGIETAPIFVKFFSPKGSYDEVLAMNEYAIWLEQQQRKSDLHEQVNHAYESSRDANKKSRDTQQLINDDILKEVAIAQAEIARKAIREWKEKQLLKAEQEPDSFIRTAVSE